MADTGALSAGTGADDNSVGTVTWSSPDNITSTSVFEYSSAINYFYPTSSHYLKATNFGFSISTGATIDGILVEIRQKANYSLQLYDKEVKIVKSDGSLGTENKADTDRNWETGYSYIPYGSSTDLWSESWESGDINDADFGVVISTQCVGGGPTPMTTYIEHIRITVYYTESSGTSYFNRCIKPVHQA